MAEKEEKKTEKPAQGKVSEQQRFSYIGFEVFPGKPKDLFKNEAERDKHLSAVRARRESGDTVRDHNTLLEERISMGEKIILSIACVIMIGALFLPWYSAYTETVDEPAGQAQQATPATPAMTPDSLLVGAEGGDTTAVLSGEELAAQTEAVTTEPQATGIQAATDEALATETGAAGTQMADASGTTTQEDGTEIIHGGVQRQKVSREHFSVAFFGSFALLGTAGDILFGSAVVAISTVLMLLMMVALLVSPLYTLFLLYGSKATGDELALKLKKGLRLNWTPLVIFFVAMLLSFFGGAYGADVPYNSFSDSYSIAAFLGALSYGVFVSMAMSVLLAVKGIEI